MMWEGESSSVVANDGGVDRGSGDVSRGEGEGGRRRPSSRERENNLRRERRRRAITTNIFRGLRSQGNYNLPINCDNNEVLKALCKEAGWVVLPDGTTFRKGCTPPPYALKKTIGKVAKTTTWSSHKRSLHSSFSSPIPSYEYNPASLDSRRSPSNNSFGFLCNSIPPSPLLAPAFEFPKRNLFNEESFHLPSFASFLPTSPTQHQQFGPSTISECDESDWSTSIAFQRMSLEDSDTMMVNLDSPTINLVNPMAKEAGAINGEIVENENGVKACEGERFEDFNDLKLTLGNRSTKGFQDF